MLAPMTSQDLRRARAAWLFGTALALAGFLPVAAFAARVVLPDAHAAVVPGLFAEPAWAGTAEAWLQSRRVPWLSAGALSGLAHALPGLLLMLGAAGLAGRGRAVLEAEKLRKEDARRRVQHYRGERVEPYLGAGLGSVD